MNSQGRGLPPVTLLNFGLKHIFWLFNQKGDEYHPQRDYKLFFMYKSNCCIYFYRLTILEVANGEVDVMLLLNDHTLAIQADPFL